MSISKETKQNKCNCDCHDTYPQEIHCIDCKSNEKLFPQPTLSQCCGMQKTSKGAFCKDICSNCQQPFIPQEKDISNTSTTHDSMVHVPLPKEDWMDKEREAFRQEFTINSLDAIDAITAKNLIADYWLSRIQSQIEAECERAFKEGYEKGIQEVGQGATRSELVRIRIAEREQGKVEERERILKMIEKLKLKIPWKEMWR